MSKKFIRIHGTAERDYDGEGIRAFSRQADSIAFDEIIPIDCLIKVYRYLPCTYDYVLIYVFIDPVTGFCREVGEMFLNDSSLAKRLEYLEKMLIQ